jgi:hypothetical protein
MTLDFPIAIPLFQPIPSVTILIRTLVIMIFKHFNNTKIYTINGFTNTIKLGRNPMILVMIVSLLLEISFVQLTILDVLLLIPNLQM